MGFWIASIGLSTIRDVTLRYPSTVTPRVIFVEGLGTLGSTNMIDFVKKYQKLIAIDCILKNKK